MNRAELQQMTTERLRDAKVLLDGQRWSYAYYVAGYAVECALKSCVLSRMIHTGGVFADKDFSRKCFTHDFRELADLAGLTDELDSRLRSNLAFRNHWSIAVDWRETSRYRDWTEAEARGLFESISNNPDGVLSWLTGNW